MSYKYNVRTSFELVYKNVKYINKEDINIEKDYTLVSNYTENESYKKKMYIDSSNYELLTFNKKKATILLFDKLDKCLLNLDKEITRNYLIHDVSYKLDYRFLSIQINQSNLAIFLSKKNEKI